ncbi:MAG: TldD/PmbA family protein [Actinomycetia bacterium]|nr:TldD/PmbA family protein [Actinomycetes bacterium]
MISAQDLSEMAINAAGSTEIAVVVQERSSVNLRWAVNTLTTNGLTQQQSVDVVAFVGAGAQRATATASGQVTNPTDIVALVEQARAAAQRAAPAASAAPLVDAGQAADWQEGAPATSSAALETVALGLGEAFGRARVDIVEHFGYAEHELTTTYLATSAGTRLRHVQPASRLEMTAKSHDRERSAWLGSAEPNMHHIDITAMDADLRRSLALQGRHVAVEPGRHPVLLSDSAVADLMIDLYWAADARSALDSASVFAAPGGGTKLGTTLAQPDVTLSSNPYDPAPGMACTPFEVCAVPEPSATPFDNGLTLSETAWIDAGQLANLITTRSTAAELGRPVTPGIDNLTLTHASGSGSIEEVAERMGDGILVTCLWYNRMVDPQTHLLTGLTRDGVYVVRGGEIAGACGNFRFNDSPASLLGRIVEAGSSRRTLAREMGDYFNRAVMPPLVIGDFNLSTLSEAR